MIPIFRRFNPSQNPSRDDGDGARLLVAIAVDSLWRLCRLIYRLPGLDF